jgi:hypothetical protein
MRGGVRARALVVLGVIPLLLPSSSGEGALGVRFHETFHSEPAVTLSGRVGDALCLLGEEGCEFLVCTTPSDCGRQCFCNNPYGCQGCGLCIKDAGPIDP